MTTKANASAPMLQGLLPDGRGIYIPKPWIDWGTSFWSVREAVFFFLLDRVCLEVDVGNGRARIGLVHGCAQRKPVRLAEIAAATGACTRHIRRVLDCLESEGVLISHRTSYGQYIAIADSPRRFKQRPQGRRQVLRPHEAVRVLSQFPELAAYIKEQLDSQVTKSTVAEGTGMTSPQRARGDIDVLSRTLGTAANRHDSPSQRGQECPASVCEHTHPSGKEITQTPPVAEGGWGGSGGGLIPKPAGASPPPREPDVCVCRREGADPEGGSAPALAQASSLLPSASDVHSERDAEARAQAARLDAAARELAALDEAGREDFERSLRRGDPAHRPPSMSRAAWMVLWRQHDEAQHKQRYELYWMREGRHG